MSGNSSIRKVRVARWSEPAKELLTRRIASLYSRGFEMYEIVQLVCEQYRPGPNGSTVVNEMYTVNPRTKKPYGKTTIYDLAAALRKEWRRKDAEKISEHFGTIVATHIELLRASWSAGDREMVLETVQSLARLTGVNAPTRISGSVVNFDPKKLTDEQLERILGGEALEQVVGRTDDLRIGEGAPR
jgi:hypothetical protein